MAGGGATTPSEPGGRRSVDHALNMVPFIDLLSVLTHEAGHFLGVAHSSESAATMFPSYDNGSIELPTP